jgi:hypothetical protein
VHSLFGHYSANCNYKILLAVFAGGLVLFYGARWIKGGGLSPPYLPDEPTRVVRDAEEVVDVLNPFVIECFCGRIIQVPPERGLAFMHMCEIIREVAILYRLSVSGGHIPNVLSTQDQIKISVFSENSARLFLKVV